MEGEHKLLAKTKDYFFTHKYNLAKNQTSDFNGRTLSRESSILGQNKYLKSINNNSQMGSKGSETWKMKRAEGYQED